MTSTGRVVVGGSVFGDTPEDALILLMMQVGRRLRSRHPDDEIEPSIMPVLHALKCQDSIRLSDLAARLHLDASTISRHIRQLEDIGLVERSGDPDDRRATQVAITDHGRRLLTASMNRRLEELREVLANWTDRDRGTLQRLVTKLATDLQADTDSETRVEGS